MHAEQKKSPRGFVIVIVVAIAAVITAIVAAQLTSGQKLAAASLRMEEEVQARAIAQACLEMVSAQIDNYMFDCGAAPLPACATRPPDFDALLIGVDGIPNNNDDFLPGIGTRVQIPRVATDRLHQWALLNLDGGACAMRIEDNSDDGRPGLPGMLDNAGPPAEGTGTDVPNRDRDLAVYVHVIGMFPRLTAVDADVYHQAHARTTLRRLIQKQNMASPGGPGLWAGVAIDIDDDNNICELGGVAAPNVDMESSTCACGPISCTTCSGIPAPGTTCSACTSGCTPSTAAAAIGPPPVNVHWASTQTPAVSFLANEGLGPPLRADPLEGDTLPEVPIGQGVTAAPATAYDLSSSQFCAFYADNAVNRPIFVWDRLDPDAGATLLNWEDDGAWAVGFTTQHPIVAALSGGAPVDCTTHTADIPPPCVWTPGATGADKATLTSCPTAKSACWKLVAWMDNTTDSHPVGLNTAQVPFRGWTDSGGDTGFHPKKSVPIPNTARIGALATASVFGVALAGQQLLCGDPNAARNCAACSSSALDIVGADTNPFSVLEAKGDHWHFEGGARDTLSPSPSVWVMEDLSSSDKDVHLKDAGAPGLGPFRATILVDGAADLESSAGVCCATCDCTALTSLSMGTCALNGTFGDSPSAILGTVVGANPALFTDTAPPVEDNRTLGPDKGGVAIKARGKVNVNNSALIIGDVRGGTVDFNNNPCVIGSVVSYDTAVGTKCGGSGICDPSHVCFNNAPKITGDVHSMSSIRFNNNPRIWGNIFAKNGVCFNDDARVEGLIQAGGSMELDQDSIIVNNVSSTSGAATTALNQALVTFMEGAW